MSQHMRVVGALSLVLSCGLAVAAGPEGGPADAPSFGPGAGVGAGVQDAGAWPVHPSQVLVRFKANAAAADVEAALGRAGVERTLREFWIVPGLRCVQVAPGSVDGAIASLVREGVVEYAHADSLVGVNVQTTPYGIDLVNAPPAWADGGSTPPARGDGAVVAVLDTGVDLLHPDLPTPVATNSFVTGEAVDDLNAHGTHCTGTVLALDNNDGVIGVAPDAELMIGKVLSNSGWGYTSWIMAGVDWAVAGGADVVSMSLGGGGYVQGFQDAILAANAANVTVVAAAGNNNSNAAHYPSGYDGVISVAAVDSSSNRASFSNFHPTVSVAAPGVGVNSTIPQITVNATWSSVARTGRALSGGQVRNVTANVYYCDIGDTADDFPAAVAGNIAHIRRGNGTFQLKVDNAEAAGAIGVIISNNVSGLFSGSLADGSGVPVIGISQADGNTLQAADGVQGTISFARTGSTYANFNGTSMACPHVAGVAALIYSNVPGVTPAQVKAAMEQTATDLGDTGRDDYYGHGLVNAQAAVASLRPSCSTDYNQDGGGDTSDVIDLANDIASGVQSFPPSNPDFNLDGGADTSDVIDLANVVAGGSCP